MEDGRLVNFCHVLFGCSLIVHINFPTVDTGTVYVYHCMWYLYKKYYVFANANHDTQKQTVRTGHNQQH